MDKAPPQLTVREALERAADVATEAASWDRLIVDSIKSLPSLEALGRITEWTKAAARIEVADEIARSILALDGASDRARQALSHDEDRGEVNLHQADGPAGAAVEKVTVPLEQLNRLRKILAKAHLRFGVATPDGVEASNLYGELVALSFERHIRDARVTADTPSTLDARGQLEPALTPVPQLQPDSNGEKNG